VLFRPHARPSRAAGMAARRSADAATSGPGTADAASRLGPAGITEEQEARLLGDPGPRRPGCRAGGPPCGATGDALAAMTDRSSAEHAA
jgi:hypothetical protein